MGMFSGIKNAKASFDSNYIRPGQYVMRIDRVKADKNRKGEGFVAIEMTTVLVLQDLSDEGFPAHKPGESVSHLLMEKGDYFLGDMKAFISKTLDCSEDEVDEAACEMVTSNENPMGGMLVEVSARNRITKAGTNFTVVNYKGQVPASEVLALIDDGAKARLFEAGELEKMVELEAAA